MTDATTGVVNVFERAAVRRNRDRAAVGFSAHDFLFREVAGRLAERLDELRRGFPRVLDLGCHAGAMAELLARRGESDFVVQTDMSLPMARAAHARNSTPATLVADEETLPFAPASFDLAVSALSLHWVNDLPGCLIQLRRALKPDGLLLAALFGGGTLGELREALGAAELAASGGMSPRVSPFADVRDAGALLQRAGFALPVVDVDTITVRYPDALALMRELRGMGEANAVAVRARGFSGRNTLFGAAERYAEAHRGADGRIPATFNILFLTGWAPHRSQQRPLARGSARARLAEALESEEQPAGERAPPE